MLAHGRIELLGHPVCSAEVMIESKRVLITGGAGFIGSALTRRLIEANDVVVFDNGHRDALSSSGLLGHPRLRVVRGDVLDPEALRSVMPGVQVILHLAAIAGVDTVLKMPVTTMRVALFGSYNVLDVAVAAGGWSGSSIFPPARCSAPTPTR